VTRDLESAVAPVADAFDALGVEYYLAGSVISSLFGIARATADVDVSLVLEQPVREFAIASAEDVVLHKLRWYRDGGEVSDRSDILGVLRVQGASLDLDHLRRWAAILSVSDLLERALSAV
jgi:hypothetical protein